MIWEFWWVCGEEQGLDEARGWTGEECTTEKRNLAVRGGHVDGGE